MQLDRPANCVGRLGIMRLSRMGLMQQYSPQNACCADVVRHVSE